MLVKTLFEETELDTKPSLTLAQTLIISTGERSFGCFTSSRCYDTTVSNFAYINSSYNQGRNQSISDEKSQLHEIDA